MLQFSIKNRSDVTGNILICHSCAHTYHPVFPPLENKRLGEVNSLGFGVDVVHQNQDCTFVIFVRRKTFKALQHRAVAELWWTSAAHVPTSMTCAPLPALSGTTWGAMVVWEGGRGGAPSGNLTTLRKIRWRKY